MSCFIEVDSFNICKNEQKISGDIFVLNRDTQQNRIVCTLSDGMGSGVKANVLANLTATMGQRFALNGVDVTHAAKRIMMTLPLCKLRKISYATFTIMDISNDGVVKLIEYDNPLSILHRNGQTMELDSSELMLEKRIGNREEKITYSEIEMLVGDRLIFFSDGVTQAGMGTGRFPVGWRHSGVSSYIDGVIAQNKNISARELSRAIVRQARRIDDYCPKDDITCGVVYFRKPRCTLVVTGAPFNCESDYALSNEFNNFEGMKVISGGTTASLIARELKQPIEVDLTNFNREIPPKSIMPGADLVTEGMLTLNRVAQILENKEDSDSCSKNAADEMVEILLNSDRVKFIVGTKINEAHQSPDMPVDMGIRRTIVNRIITALEKNYLKETSLEYL